MSIFEQVSRSLKVSAICGPMGRDVPSGTDLFAVEELLDPSDDPNLDPMNIPSRVIDDSGNLVGILWYQNWALEEENDSVETVDDVMEIPGLHDCIEAEATISEAIKLFSEKDFTSLYVVRQRDVVGILEYNDLFKSVGRLLFFALVLEIEEKALSLCRSRALREPCWLSLSEGRRCKSIELFKQRHKRDPEHASDISLLIECTTLADKATMLWKQRLIVAASRGDVLGFFERLNTIRNRCAHPGGNQAVVDRPKLSQFIVDARRMSASLDESIKAHRISLRRTFEFG